ncbi:MAG: hypothetical protein HY809_04730 [Nitrospirae bacterium]|nr:hypothetical protein [Nitrospirota bacterium]
MPGLSNEVVSKLEEIRPLDVGQAGRIPCVTLAAISLLMIAAGRQRLGLPLFWILRIEWIY